VLGFGAPINRIARHDVRKKDCHVGYKESLGVWLPEPLFALSGEVAVTGQSLLAVSGQILLAANSDV
jgi:hypothetical protein